MEIKLTKKDRHIILNKKIEEEPFLRDEELSEIFGVSVPTIRLDRLELGIPEVRERIKLQASANYQKIRSLKETELTGEIMFLELNKRAVSILETDENMVFNNSKVVRGNFIYSMAESLAISVIDAHVALVGVANIKYKIPVRSNTRLRGEAEVIETRGMDFIVWVKIFVEKTEVFRGKFILVVRKDFD